MKSKRNIQQSNPNSGHPSSHRFYDALANRAVDHFHNNKPINHYQNQPHQPNYPYIPYNGHYPPNAYNPSYHSPDTQHQRPGLNNGQLMPNNQYRPNNQIQLNNVNGYNYYPYQPNFMFQPNYPQPPKQPPPPFNGPKSATQDTKVTEKRDKIIIGFVFSFGIIILFGFIPTIIILYCKNRRYRQVPVIENSETNNNNNKSETENAQIFNKQPFVEEKRCLY